MDTFLWSRDIVAPIVFPFIYCILIGKPLLDEAISITGVEDVIDRLLVGFGSLILSRTVDKFLTRE